MMGEPVRVRFSKYDGALHWHFTAYRLGVDEYGTWLGCPAGTVMRRGTEVTVTWEVAQVCLVPEGRWWVANFNAAPYPTEVYSDMATVPVWDGDTVTAVDLDLDVVRRRDGTVAVLDEDEFAEHQLKYGYSKEVVAGARAAADEVYTAVAADAEPFATVYRTWLAKVTD